MAHPFLGGVCWGWGYGRAMAGRQDLPKGALSEEDLWTRSPPGPLALGTRQGPDRPSGLSQAPDFYVEMKWEFTSWGEWGLPGVQGLGEGLWERTSVTSVPSAVPLVSKMCPSDVYRVWKRGESLRVDTSLLGFEHMTWQRGRRSFIFKGQGELGGG